MNIKIVINSIILMNYLSVIVVAYNGSECDSDPIDPDYKPHPSYCALFFQCSSNGTYVLHTCPGDLHFNPILNVCDYPHLAGCFNNNSTTSDPGLTQSTTVPWTGTTASTESTTEPGTSTTASTESTTVPGKSTTTPTESTTEPGTSTNAPTESTTVPATSSTATDKCNEGEYLIHEDDCEAFYRCIAGRFILIYCPNDMQFNITSKTCEVEDFMCNEEEQSTITPEITTTVGSTEGSTQMCYNNEYQPDRSDCEAFYRCVNGQFILLFCPLGMHFNQNTRQCDRPEVAECEVFGLLAEVKCSDNEYQSHPTDCEAFHRCINGEFVLLYCPVGMHFNGSTRQCDLPQAAECSYVSK